MTSFFIVDLASAFKADLDLHDEAPADDDGGDFIADVVEAFGPEIGHVMRQALAER